MNKIFLLIAGLILCLNCSSQTQQMTKIIDAPKSTYQLERDMIDLVNSERKKRGLSTLRVSIQLCEIARKHSEEQKLDKTIFHISPTNGLSHAERLKNDNYWFKSSGENVATSPNLRLSHLGLMNSPGHYKNIVGDWSEIGIGIKKSENGQLYITQLFAIPIRQIDCSNFENEVIKVINNYRIRNKHSPFIMQDLNTFNKHTQYNLPNSSTPFLEDCKREIKDLDIRSVGLAFYSIRDHSGLLSLGHLKDAILTKSYKYITVRTMQNYSNGLTATYLLFF